MEDLLPVISAKLKNKTLSSKKKLKVKKVRNVLASPYLYNYWPLLDEYQDNDLSDTLTRSALFLGVNSTLRALEKGEAAAVILAGDIMPPGLIGQPVVDMCSTKNVPIIVMPTLRQVVKQCLGFGCIALGVKSDSIHNQHFQELQEKIKYLSSLHPPQNGPQFEKVLHSKVHSNDCSGSVVSKLLGKGETKEMQHSIYKYRSSKAERAFIPNPTQSDSTTSSDNVLLLFTGKTPKSSFGQDFVSFEFDSSSVPITPVSSCTTESPTSKENQLKRKQISSYKPLIVKCMQPNPNKKKKKSKQ